MKKFKNASFKNILKIYRTTRFETTVQKCKRKNEIQKSTISKNRQTYGFKVAFKYYLFSEKYFRNCCNI